MNTNKHSRGSLRGNHNDGRGNIVHDFISKDERRHPATCRTRNGVEYGSVEKQAVHMDVSVEHAFNLAFKEAAKHDVTKLIEDQQRFVREQHQQLRNSALNLEGF